MNETNSKSEKQEKERSYDIELLKKGLRCDLDQYDFLISCSKKGEEGINEWNRSRKEHRRKDILLEGAKLCNSFLKGAYLGVLTAMDSYGHGYFCGKMFPVAPEKKDNFQTVVDNAGKVYMKKAQLQRANLKETLFWHTDLEGADLNDSHVEGAEFWQCNLKDADVRTLCVDNRTMFWGCQVNRYRKKKGDSTDQNRFTNFEGVPLENARMNARAKHIMEYNIRRMNWERWYKEYTKLKWLVKPFWWISDYGISTKRIIFTFFGLAFVFAIIYYAWGLIDYHLVCNKDYPGIVSNLFVLEDSKQAVSGWLVPLRSIYFSVVTMTTLGLGDMYANAHSLFRGIFGHILLAFQVILGYVLLGALVTRFAVLFTAGGPAGKFADEKEKEDKKK